MLTPATADPVRPKTARERADVIVAGHDPLDFPAAVRELAARGHRRLLCEGGPAVLAQIAAAGLLDELCLTLSPLLLAGHPAGILNGPPLTGPPEMTLAHALQDGDFLFLPYTRSR